MGCANEKFIHSYANNMAPESERQMPVFSQVGKGLRGDNCVLELVEVAGEKQIACVYNNQMTGSSETLWMLPYTELAPEPHYKVWRGVREINDVYMWVHWIEFECWVAGVYVWAFSTPITAEYPFIGEEIPEDAIIDSDQEI